MSYIQRPRHFFGLVVVSTLFVSAVSFAQQGFKPPKEIPKGPSTKQPSSDKPGPSVEELQGLPGAPDPSNNDVPSAYDSYPEWEKAKEANASEDDGKGSLPPIEIPKGPHRLEFKMLRPVEYAVRGMHRLAIQDREDLKQVYMSSAKVRYEKLKDLSDRPESIWVVSKPHEEGAAQRRDMMPVLVSVEKSAGRYTYPELLADQERVHQITRNAKLSYLLSPQGKIEDVQVHAPTNPLAKTSLEHFSTMLSMSQAAFPDKPVGPGDTWTQKILYRDADGLAQLSEDSTNTFTFDRWRSCRKSVCAFIRFKQDLRSAGRLLVADEETRGTSIGEGEGWILFDYKAGEVVKAYMKLKGLGSVEAFSKKPSGVSPDAKARVLVEYEVVTERVDSEDAAPLPIDAMK